MNSSYLNNKIEEFYKVLEFNILSFWTNKMIDPINGGFIGQIDGLNVPHPNANKSVILNTRILWSFSAVYQHIPKTEYRKIADRAYQYLCDNFLDKENGGVFWTLNAVGEVRDSKKQIYAQAFMIYALTEYYKFSQKEEALNLAISLYKLIEHYSWDVKDKGYLEAFDQEWNLLEDLRLSDKDANEKKTMNTHLHVLEAYTNLYRIWPDATLALNLKRLIALFLEKFIDENGHFVLFFNEKWEARAPKISYGHDIEGSWLLFEAAEVLGDETFLKQVKKASLYMADIFLKEGISPDNGVYNEFEHNQTDGEFHWWPQAEALVGLSNAWEITGKIGYLEKMFQIWEYIKENIIDWDNGEWHWGVDQYGKLLEKEDKAGPWKCPYHNSRALLELISRLKV